MDVAVGEYRERLERIRIAMTARALDALLVYSWKRGQVRYVTGYTPNYIANAAMAILPAQGEPGMVIRFPFDLERARAACWFSDISAGGNISGIGAAIAERLRTAGLDRAYIGLVSGDTVMDELPYTLFGQLRGELAAVTFSDERDIFTTLRRTKSPAECRLLTDSARLADVAAAAAAKALTPGVREFDIVAAAEGAARIAGADQYLVTIASQGAHDLIGPPEDKIVGADDMVIVEVAVQLKGYWTQVARVLRSGIATKPQRDIYRATHAAYVAGAAAAVPGRPMADVGQAIRNSLSAAGLAGYMEHDMGHGIGLDLPDPPSLDAGGDERIEVGMALVVHPSIRVPGVGGAFVGGTILVSANGPQPIHIIPEDLT